MPYDRYFDKRSGAYSGPSDLLDLFGNLESKYNLKPGRLLSLLYSESPAKVRKSSAGAIGPFQVVPNLAKDYGISVDQLEDPYVAAKIAAQEIAKQTKALGGEDQALAAWNWGRGNLRKQGWFSPGGEFDISKLPNDVKQFIQKNRDADAGLRMQHAPKGSATSPKDVATAQTGIPVTNNVDLKRITTGDSLAAFIDRMEKENLAQNKGRSVARLTPEQIADAAASKQNREYLTNLANARARGETSPSMTEGSANKWKGKSIDEVLATSPLDAAKGFARGVISAPAALADIGALTYAGASNAMGRPDQAMAAKEFSDKYGMSGVSNLLKKYVPGLGDSSDGSGIGDIGEFAGAMTNPTSAAKAYGRLAAEAVGRGMESEGTLGKLLSASKPMNITTYHGSPNIFDAFSLDKASNKFSNQAYGHGLYYTELPEIAKVYQKLMSKPELTVKGNVMQFEDLDPALKGIARDLSNFNGDVGALKSYYGDLKGLNVAQERLARLNDIGNDISVRRGGLYKVDIPDSIIPKMLDWNRPLSEQQNIVRAVQKEFPSFLEKGIPPNAMGSDAYMQLAQPLGNEGASTYLRGEGIPGLKYIDTSTLNKTGANNYVLYDDKLPRILEINDVPTGNKPWMPWEPTGYADGGYVFEPRVKMPETPIGKPPDTTGTRGRSEDSPMTIADLNNLISEIERMNNTKEESYA